jgi:hypothetical protein
MSPGGIINVARSALFAHTGADELMAATCRRPLESGVGA